MGAVKTLGIVALLWQNNIRKESRKYGKEKDSSRRSAYELFKTLLSVRRELRRHGHGERYPALRSVLQPEQLVLHRKEGTLIKKTRAGLMAMGLTISQGKKKPRQRFIDEVWPGMKP